MTPLAGFVAAILAAWIIREPRRAAAAIIVPFLAVLAVQTWTLASGRGDNPTSTPQGVSYWVVQAIALAFALGIATQLAIILRARTGGARQDDAGASRRALRATALLLVLAAAFVIGVVLDSHPVLHHNANSPLPLSGVIGIVGLVGGLVVVTVLRLVQRRAGARQRKLAVEDNPGTTVASSYR